MEPRWPMRLLTVMMEGGSSSGCWGSSVEEIGDIDGKT